MTEEQPTARVLVEGGPVHRHLSRWLAVLTGVMVGVLPVLGWIGVEALTASSEIQGDRRAQCVKANERHVRAKGFVDQLVAKGPRPHTTTEARVQNEQAVLFLEAIAPKYDCRTF